MTRDAERALIRIATLCGDELLDIEWNRVVVRYNGQQYAYMLDETGVQFEAASGPERGQRTNVASMAVFASVILEMHREAA